MDIATYNREAWSAQVKLNNRWTIPVSPEVVAAARRGDWSLVLTPTKPVPADWYPPIVGCDVLCLASGGGQQGPILAAAGARVTVYDLTPAQLDRDRLVAERDGLELRTIAGDMRDLSSLADDSFDLIFHPVSNVFIPNILPVWKEAFRVLRPGGILLSGFMNPVLYIFNLDLMDEGKLEVHYSIPYSDLESLPEDKKQKLLDSGFPVEFGHTLEDQIGGQLNAGFLMTGFYEDADPETPLSKIIPVFIATRSIKPK